MEDSPLVMPSSGIYNFALVVTIVIWSFLSSYVAQYALVELSLELWLLQASGFVLFLIPCVFAILWIQKNRIALLDVEWEFREKEIAFSEYEKIAMDYAQTYSGIIQTVDLWWLVASLLTGISSLSLPFVFAFSHPILIQVAPFVFGFTMVLYGISVSVFLRSFISAPISSEFPFVPPKYIRNAISLFISTPSLSWTGVSIDIGRFGDYYVLEDLKVVGRIDSIESVARIVAELDESGEIKRIVPELNFKDAPKIESIKSNISPASIQLLIVEIIKIYVKLRGSNELLDEVLEELSIDITIE
ncbi:MAG: hypothetical protein GF411_10345 [Candidatus Lokiarchaeota archaeon]|nr:hypothetical protein [Candidatus Lokiarchaeota archaeon]